MKDNTLYAVITICVTLLTAGAIAGAVYRGGEVSRQRFELRKSYIEKCKLTPDQVEKLLPDETTP